MADNKRAREHERLEAEQTRDKPKARIGLANTTAASRRKAVW
jgi:hypothetical protein